MRRRSGFVGGVVEGAVVSEKKRGQVRGRWLGLIGVRNEWIERGECCEGVVGEMCL